MVDKKRAKPPSEDEIAERMIAKLHRQRVWESTLDRAWNVPRRTRARAVRGLGLSAGEVLFLSQSVTDWFLQRANLGIEDRKLAEGGSRDEWDLQKHVVIHARAYGKAVEQAVSEFADLLTQAVLARRRGKNLLKESRAAIWRSAIEFAFHLASEAVWVAWLKAAEAPVVPQSVGWAERERGLFKQRLVIYRSDWLREADRRIGVRLLLAGGELHTRTVNAVAARVGMLLVEKPDLDDKSLCLELDRQNERNNAEEVPNFLKKASIRLWSDPFRDNNRRLIQSLHEYFSRIRREYGDSDDR